MPHPLLHAMTTLAFVLHIGAGVLGLISGTVAAIARKGGPVHRKAGRLFFVSMIVMATFAIYLAVVMPDQLVNVFIVIFAAYLVATGWMAVRRKAGATGAFERVVAVIGLCLCAPFGILSFQLLCLTPLFQSAMPFKGPLLTPCIRSQ